MKKFYPVLLVVALAAIAIGVTYWRGQNQLAVSPEQPVSDAKSDIDTANWKSYQDKEHGFTHKYPKDWKEERGAVYSPEMYNAREGGPYSLLVSLEPGFSSISSFLNSIPTCPVGVDYFKINNEEAVSYFDSCGYEGPHVVVTKKDGKLIIGTSYSFSDEKQVINQILSTFKFIDPAPVSTEDWETYSKEHKFTFEFPSQWTSSFQDNVFYASGTDGAIITVRLNNELPFGEMEEPKKKAITIGGVKTELLSWSEGEYYFDLENPRNKELVQIFYSYGNSNINYGEFFDEILSSIQFPAN